MMNWNVVGSGRSRTPLQTSELPGLAMQQNSSAKLLVATDVRTLPEILMSTDSGICL
jgi:hypothetical protein